MNDEEIWELAKKPVTEFVEAIKQLDLNVDKLMKFYLEHTREPSSERTQLVNDAALEEEEKRHTLSPLAKAKLELAIVFSINTCYWLYIVTHGENPIKKEISKDIERIKLFMNRAKEVEDSLNESRSSVKRPRIDKEASKRLCMNNISLKQSWD